MISRGSLWLPLAILLLLAALSFWIERSVQVASNGDQASKTDPEGIMENFDALSTDLSGRPHYRLSAKRLKHYSASQKTELESPRFILLDAQTGEVSAEARLALVSPDGNEVDMQGAVLMQRAARDGQSALTLSTERLIVFPKQDLLRAPGTVDIQDATLTLRAGAMEFDAKKRIINLTGRVKARYLSGKG